jgi:outer membrane protein TolC
VQKPPPVDPGKPVPPVGKPESLQPSELPPALGGDPRKSPKKIPTAPGLTLEQLVARARLNDPRAQQAQAQLMGAQAKREEVDWLGFPHIEATGAIAGPTPEARLLNGDTGDLNQVTPGTRDFWSGSLGVAYRVQGSLVWPLWTMGKLSNGKAAAKHGVGVAEALLARARDQASFDISRAFWGYQTAHAGVVSIDSVRKRIADAQKTAKELFADGSDQVTAGDVGKLDYLKEEIEAQYAVTVKNERLAYNAIRALIDAQPDEELEVQRRELPPAPEMPDRQAMVVRGLERRPEIKAAREGVLARARLVDVERAKLRPDLALVGGATFTYTTNASNPSTPFAYNPYNERTAYAALAITGNFDIPTKLAKVRQAEADLSETQALARGAEALVRLEVETALNDLEEARKRVTQYTKQSEIGKQLAVKAGLAFEGGLGNARDLLEGTLLYARADGERLKALFDAQIAWAALDKAVGGL